MNPKADFLGQNKTVSDWAGVKRVPMIFPGQVIAIDFLFFSYKAQVMKIFEFALDQTH